MKHFFSLSIRNFLAAGILAGVLLGCKVIDPAEEIPSYLHIDAMTLSATGNQGSSTSKITDAWVFMDGSLLGGFELPCNIPILAEGAHSFLIKGGVKMNGLSSTRAIYPFWKGWEGTVTLVRGQKVSVGTPSVVYFPGLDFGTTWMENFESPGTSVVPEPVSSATIVRVSGSAAYEGSSGFIHLNNTDTLEFIGASPVAYTLPAATDTWIEMDYRSNVDFTVGIEQENYISNKTPWLLVTANDSWNKIYIRLTDVLAAATQNVNYKIYIASKNTASIPDGHVYLDNIKLLK